MLIQFRPLVGVGIGVLPPSGAMEYVLFMFPAYDFSVVFHDFLHYKFGAKIRTIFNRRKKVQIALQ